MHQQCKRFVTETVGIIVINLKTQTVCIIIRHHHFTIAREHTCIDHVIECPTIAGSEIEIRGQLQTHKEFQRFAVAVEFKVGVHDSNLNPRFQISKREKVARFVNTNQLGFTSPKVLQSDVNLLGSVCNTDLQVRYNGFQIVLPVEIGTIVLHLRRCSEATELGVLTVTNRTLAIAILNSERFAEQSTWAGLTCGQVEDQGVGAKLSVTLGESESHVR